MTKQEFLQELTDILETDEFLTENTNLFSIRSYDSLSMMSIIAMVFTNFKVKLQGSELAKVTTVQSLINLIGDDKYSK